MDQSDCKILQINKHINASDIRMNAADKRMRHFIIDLVVRDDDALREEDMHILKRKNTSSCKDQHQ